MPNVARTPIQPNWLCHVMSVGSAVRLRELALAGTGRRSVQHAGGAIPGVHVAVQAELIDCFEKQDGSEAAARPGSHSAQPGFRCVVGGSTLPVRTEWALMI